MKRLAAAVFLTLIACGSSAASPPVTHVSPAVAGGTAKQRALLTKIVTDAPSAGVRRITLGRPDAVWAPVPRHSTAVRFTDYEGADDRTAWDEELIAAAFRDRSFVRRLPAIVVYEGGNGTGGRIGPVRRVKRPRPVTDARIAEIRAGVSRAAAQASAELVGLTLPKPWGLGVAVGLRVADPARFLHDRLRGFATAVHRDLAPIEGTFIRIEAADGSPVMTVEWARRFGGFGYRVRPDLAGCNPYDRGPRQPPPCPAP